MPAAAACVLFVMAGAASESDRTSKTMFIVSFSVYLSTLLAFTLLGRGINPIFSVNITEEWLKSHVYLKPFEIITYYAGLLFTYRWKTAVFNIFGNLAAFAPAAFYLPRLCPIAGRRGVFLLIMFGAAAFIETTQLILGCGIFDVDDFILNISGAWAAYELMSLRKVKSFLDKSIKPEK